jgi:hypothetical protein
MSLVLGQSYDAAVFNLVMAGLFGGLSLFFFRRLIQQKQASR